ncbi:MAG: hypothetical protein KGJ40_01535 [candidate division NC10 bacterium]|nr:hypothetical protein [candidate division NC10 bacterium]
MNFGLLAFFGLVFVFGALRWRQAVMGAMVLAVFEGALRKWVFQGEQQWVYMMKDMLLLGAYAGFFVPRLQRHNRLFEHHPANASLALLAVVAALQLANPALPNLQVGLFGLRAYLVYVPLLYLVPAVFSDAADAMRFWTLFLALSLLPLALGPIQFASPQDSDLNRYVSVDELAPGVAGFAGWDAPRITGTFSYISGYTAYLMLLVLIGLALALVAQRTWLRWSLYGLLGLVVGNLLMTGSRGPFLVLGVAVPALLVLAFRMGLVRWQRTAVALCVGVPLAALLAGSAFPDGYQAFLERVRENEDVPERIAGIITEPLWAFGEAGLFGYGIGNMHQAKAFLAPTTEGAEPPGAEGEWERIILELGPVGFGLVVLIRLLVSWRLWTALRAVRGTPLALFLNAALLYSLISLPGNLVFNHTAHLFYWFLAGHALIPGVQEMTTDQELRVHARARQRTALLR